MSYYTCGPLALSVLPVALIGFLIWAAAAGVRLSEGMAMGLILLVVLLPVAPLYAWLSNLFHICRRIMPENRWRPYLIPMTVLVSCPLLVVPILVGIPFIVFFVVIVFASLW